MPNQPTEQQKADLSKSRAKTAAGLASQGHFTSPADEQKFISAQGDAEAKGALTTEKADQLKQQGTQSFHKGGKIKKYGKQTIVAEKGETVLPTHDAKRVTELVMDHMKGMTDAMKSEKKDKKEKVAPMNEAHHGTEHTKRSHSFKRTVIVHHKHGGHTTTHEHDEGPDKDVEYSSDHMDGVLDGLQSNAGEPNEGEPQADAGQHGVPEPMASDAGLPPAGPAQG